MDNAETPKVWYVTHDGQQFGPVSHDDLKFEAQRGELNPRLDMVWKDGMEDWIPAGDVDGLFEKNKDAEEEEKTKATAAPAPRVEEDCEEEKRKGLAMQGDWPGTGRFAYFFMSFVFPILFGLGLGAARSALEGKMEAGLMDKIFSGLLIIPVIILIVVILGRLVNLVMSRWWLFGMLVPFMNLWVQYRVFACPPGYGEHKKMDTLGWILGIFYWLLVLIFTATIAFLAYGVIQNPQEFQSLETPGEFIEHFRKNYGLK